MLNYSTYVILHVRTIQWVSWLDYPARYLDLQPGQPVDRLVYHSLACGGGGPRGSSYCGGAQSVVARYRPVVARYRPVDP